MIEQQGRVMSADGDRVSIRLGATSGCNACDSGSGCGAGVFGRLLRRRPVVMDFENTVGAESGQAVIVGLPEALFLALVVRFYLYPLLAAMIGAALGHVLARELLAGEVMTDISALAAALLSALVVIRRNRKYSTEFPGEKAVHLLRTVECKDSNL